MSRSYSGLPSCSLMALELCFLLARIRPVMRCKELLGLFSLKQSACIIPRSHPTTFTFLSLFFLNTAPHSEFMFSLYIVELILYSLNFHKLEVRSRGVWLRYRLSILSSSFIDNSVQKSLKVSVMVISPIFAFPAKELVIFPKEPWLLLVGNNSLQPRY